MVSINKVQHGLAVFIDRELIPSLTGWDKVIIGGASGLIAAKLPKFLSQYPVLAALELYSPESNQIDIDAVYQAIIPYLGTEALPLKIPMVGITVKVGRTEVDTLYRYIKEA